MAQAVQRKTRSRSLQILAVAALLAVTSLFSFLLGKGARSGQQGSKLCAEPLTNTTSALHMEPEEQPTSVRPRPVAAAVVQQILLPGELQKHHAQHETKGGPGNFCLDDCARRC